MRHPFLARLAGGLLIGTIILLFTLLGFAVAGCQNRSDTGNPVGDKTLAAVNFEARSKSSALFGTIGDRPDAAPEVKRMTQVGERLNGAATPQDYDWAKAVAASDKARDAAVAKADKLAAQVADLTAKLAAAPSREELQRSEEKGARWKAELDAFARATARNGIIGVVVILVCAVAAWQFERAQIFGWGVLGSFSLNLEPYVVKRVSESPVLPWVIGLLIAAGGGFAAFELVKAWRADRKAKAAGEAGGTPALPGFFARLWAKVRAWFAGVALWIRTRFGKAAPVAPGTTPPAA